MNPRDVRAARDAVADRAARAAARASTDWPAEVVTPPIGAGPVVVRWNGTELPVPYSDHLTDLAAGQVVILTVAADSTPFVACRLAGTTE